MRCRESGGPRRRIDPIFQEFRTDGPGCAVGVMRDGALVFAKGYGLANVEHGTPITPKTAFYVGSVSKQFTAMTVAHLAQQGKLSLDDDVRKHIPGARNARFVRMDPVRAPSGLQ